MSEKAHRVIFTGAVEVEGDAGHGVAFDPITAVVMRSRGRLTELEPGLISTLLTTTMTGMKDVVNLVKDNGLSDRVKVIVGGAPVSQAITHEMGAGGYGYDAADAVTLVKQLTGVA